jgi:hypothetical protein
MAITDRVELVANSKSLNILNICGVVYLTVWLFGSNDRAQENGTKNSERASIEEDYKI